MDTITLSTLGTYKEIEYLKRSMGPVLVTALAELCMKRPSDPIEYLGHWLLRWRYNEELKRRDMENALEVIRQRQKAKCEKDTGIVTCKLPLDPYGEGVIPNYPLLPPGYAGPVCPSDLAGLFPKCEDEEEEEMEEEADANYEMPGEGYEYMPQPNLAEIAGEGGYFMQDPQYYYQDQGQNTDPMSSQSQYGQYQDSPEGQPPQQPDGALENLPDASMAPTDLAGTPSADGAVPPAPMPQ